MEAIAAIGLLMGASWASGINLYATVLVLGLCGNLGYVDLPQSMAPVMTWPVLSVAGFLYCIEFVADKIPAVDSFWDSAHTFIRPLGGAALAFMAVGDSAPEFQLIATMIGGALALESHATKAITRLAVNTSPEPVSNSIVSITEDIAVAGLLGFAIAYPIPATILVILMSVFCVWLIWKLSKFLFKAGSGLLTLLGLKKKQPVIEAAA